jgi:peptidoglycan/xylan/chitin deacetylase (PgdA/CDA1 family)
VPDQELQAIFEIDGLNLRQRGVQATWWSCVTGASRFKRSLRAEKIGLLRSICKSVVPMLSEMRWTLLNVRELQQLARSGMSVGAHTMSHPVLAQCTEDEARREIIESKAELERVLAQPVWALAYPFGTPATMGQREVNLARDAKFECAFANAGGGAVDASERYVLARTHVTSGMSLAEFEAHLSGFHTWLQATVRR